MKKHVKIVMQHKPAYILCRGKLMDVNWGIRRMVMENRYILQSQNI